jgi:phage-related protein
MAEDIGINAKVSLDSTGFNTAISDINRQLVVAKAQFREASSSVNGFGNDTASLGLKSEMLSEQFELQKQRVETLQEAYEKLVVAQGEDSKAAENMQIRLLNAQTQMNKTKNELEDTNSKINEQSSVWDKLSGVTQTVHEKMSGLLDGLKNSFYTLAGIAAGGAGLFELTNKAVEAGNATYELSEKLHVTTQEASQMSKIFSITDTDTQPFIATISKLDKAVESAGKKGNTTTKSLEEFGVKLTDAHGKLLPLPDQLQVLSEAYKKATEAGNDEAFSSEVLGAKGQQLIPLLEQYTEAKQAASQVKGIGIDPKEAHETEEQLQVLKIETKQLGMTFANALMPVTQALIPTLMSAFTNLAQTINSHQAEIKQFANNLIDAGKSIGSTLMPVVKTLFNLISEHGAASKTIIEGLAGAFLFFGPVESILTGVHNKYAGLMEFACGDITKNAIKGIKDFATNLSFKDISFGSFEGLTGGLKTVGSAMSTVITGPYKIFINGMKGLPELIRGISFGDIVSKITNPFTKIPELFTGVKTAFTGLGSSIVTKAPQILGGFKQAFSIEGLMNIAKGAFGLVTNPWGALVIGIVAGVGAIIANWSTIKAWVQQHFGTTLPTSFNQFKQIFEQIWKSISQTFTGVWNNIKQVVTDVWNYISPTIKGAVSELQSFWNQVWPEIKQVFVEVWNVMKVVLAPAVAFLYTTISTALGFIKGAWISAWNSIKDELKFAWDTITGVIRIAWDIISGVIRVGLDILTGNWRQAWNDFRNIFVNVWHDLGSLIGNVGRDALNWGRDIINGVINGLRGAAGGLFSAVSNIANSIASNFKSALGIHSPSRVMMELGGFTVQGLNEGLKNNSDMITNTMSNIASAISQPISIPQSSLNALNGLSANLNLGVNYPSPVVAGTTSQSGTTNIINFNGNYGFNNKQDIDYFMKQAALLAQRRGS